MQKGFWGEVERGVFGGFLHRSGIFPGDRWSKLRGELVFGLIELDYAFSTKTAVLSLLSGSLKP